MDGIDAMYIQFLYSVILAYVLQKLLNLIFETRMFLSYALYVQIFLLIYKAAEAELNKMCIKLIKFVA